MFTTSHPEVVSTPNHTGVDLVHQIVYHDCLPRHNMRTERQIIAGILDDEQTLVVFSNEPFEQRDIMRMLLDPHVRHVRNGEACDYHMDALSFHDAMRFIARERVYQIEKYGLDKKQSVAGFFTIIRKELTEAETGWFHNTMFGRHSPLAGITQIAASAVACIQKYGATGCPIATDDVYTDGGFDPDAL